MNNLDKFPDNFSDLSTSQTPVKKVASVKQALSQIPEVKEGAPQSEIHQLSIKSDQIPISAGNVARTELPLPTFLRKKETTEEKKVPGIKTRHLPHKKEKDSSTQLVTQPAAQSAEKIAQMSKSLPKINVDQPISKAAPEAKKNLKKNKSQPQPGKKGELDFEEEIASRQEPRIADKVSKKFASFEKDLNQLSKDVTFSKKILATLKNNLTQAELEVILEFLGCDIDEFDETSTEFAKKFLKQILIHSRVDPFIEELNNCECYATNKKPVDLIKTKLNEISNEFNKKFDDISNLYKNVKLEGIPEETDISNQYSSNEYNLLVKNDYNEFVENLLSQNVKETMKTLDGIIKSKIESFEQERIETSEMRKDRTTDPEKYVKKINEEYALYAKTIPERKSEKILDVTPEVGHRTYSRILKADEKPLLETTSYKMTDGTYLDYTESTTAQRTKMSLKNFENAMQNQFDQRLEKAIREKKTANNAWLDQLTTDLEAMTDNYLKEQHKLEENPIHLERYQGVLQTVVNRNVHIFTQKVLEIHIKIFTEKLYNVALKNAIEHNIEFDNDWHADLKQHAEIEVDKFFEKNKKLTADNQIRLRDFFKNYLNSKLEEFKLVNNYVNQKIEEALRAAQKGGGIEEEWFQGIKSTLKTSLDTFLEKRNLVERPLERKRYMELLDAKINKIDSEFNNESENEFSDFEENE